MFAQLAETSSYDTNGYYTTSSQLDPGAAAAIFIFLAVFGVIFLILTVLTIIGMWKTFTRAGQPGWAAIVPFYNIYVLVELSGSPMWYFWVILVLSLTSWIPLIGLLLSAGIIVMQILLGINVAKSFGKDTGYGVLLALLPFVGFMILGFSKKTHYVGPMGVAAHGGTPAAPPPPPVPPAQPPQPPTPPAEPPTPPAAPGENEPPTKPSA